MKISGLIRLLNQALRTDSKICSLASINKYADLICLNLELKDCYETMKETRKISPAF